ncbi:hypothetical protein [Dongia sp.]|uniref:hypothetical protein n=1 Tax=Dongia sp. TaxID=1977262 RepID=UPI0035B43591
MEKFRNFATALLAILSAVPAAHAHWAYPNALTKMDIEAKIIGSTLSGVIGDVSFAEYYLPDGTLRGVDAEKGPYTGRWSIRGDDAMCWAYAPSYEIAGCVLLVLDGDQVTLQQISGDIEGVVTLSPGNAQNL